ncbi:MAG: hypothetical protein DRN61_06990 [Thaumarchaeota archaeon]|nr:MAG: hypothetical protein DRN61_06990 [Nitrososphaerota archaeon]
MQIKFIIIGAVMLGIAWWMTQPLQTNLFGLIPVQMGNPLQPFSFPVALTGVGSLAYGILSKKKRR